MAVANPDGGHGGGYGHGGGHGGGYGHNAHPNYNFDYAVKADYGGNFGHQEDRDGYKAKGQYFVHLPDGRVQTVNYFTDEWGYHANVDYKGQAKHPSYYGPAVTFKHEGGYH
ncbi:pro-resilin-like [Oratosquilla oratoria]|uniref:pro-resilin-like n=1 Tax=Oratosquilla oratoria TaxID=337810 RepID=UPI003F76D85B